MAAGSQKPRYLVLGPGGVKGFYILGALQRLHADGLLSDIKGYSGSSVGAMISLLLNIGYTPTEIMKMACEVNLFADFYDVNLGEKLKEIKDNHGLISNIAVRNKLEQAMTAKYSRSDLTLYALYMITGIELYIVSYNATKSQAVYFSYKTHPDVEALGAVLLSINIPLLFYQIKYKGDVYYDGGFCDPLPIRPFDDGISKVLAIYIKTYHSMEDGAGMMTVLGIIHKIMTTSIHQLSDMIIATASPNCSFMEISTQSMNTSGLGMTLEEKVKMIIGGSKVADIYLKTLIQTPKASILALKKYLRKKSQAQK